ncbi:hypothetical protein CLOP_g9580 [Closterium sp. NIES-67]|nr:hypothetical protein CLOP_g9580 [Closterium sp. NIES-67]
MLCVRLMRSSAQAKHHPPIPRGFQILLSPDAACCCSSRSTKASRQWAWSVACAVGNSDIFKRSNTAAVSYRARAKICKCSV